MDVWRRAHPGAPPLSSSRQLASAPLPARDLLLLVIVGLALIGCAAASYATRRHGQAPSEGGGAGASAAPAGRQRRDDAAPLPPRRATYGAPASEPELIELLAELYARTELARRRLSELEDSSRERLTPEERRELEMLRAADQEESIRGWLRERQGRLGQLKLELLREQPRNPAAIQVCQDGPKILVLPNASAFVYCYTRDQWLERLWADLRLAPYHYPILALSLLIFLVGATGNVFVCLSVYRNHSLRSVTNYFIVNLAAADLLVILICLPATQVWDLSLTWFFGSHACKLIMFLQDLSVSVSVLTLAAISLDRYYAVCHPLRFKSSLSWAKRSIALIWLVSALVMSPDLLYLSAHPSQELREAGLDTILYSDCDYDWTPRASKLFQFIKTFLLYLVPLSLMFCAHYVIMRTLRRAATTCCPATTAGPQTYYEPPRRASDCAQGSIDQPEAAAPLQLTMHNREKLESRRKAAKMLTAIVLIFALCYLPVHLINSLRQLIDNIPQTELTSSLSMLAHCACYLNSAINPIIYNHMNSIFRAEFRKFLRQCACWPLASKKAAANHRTQQSISGHRPPPPPRHRDSGLQQTVLVELA